MATIGSAKATLVNKIDSLTSSATAKDTIFLAKALKENTTHHSFTYQGAWATTTTYALDDVVTVNGNTYICILSHVAPASFVVGSHWDVMATKGTDGTNGTTVGTGTAGQVLKTNSAGTGIEWGADAGFDATQTLLWSGSQRSSATINLAQPMDNFKLLTFYADNWHQFHTMSVSAFKNNTYGDASGHMLAGYSTNHIYIKWSGASTIYVSAGGSLGVKYVVGVA